MVFYTLVLQFYLNNGQKQKRRWYLSEENKIEKKTKCCYHNEIWRWKRDSFFNEVETTRGIVWIIILKKRILKKI